ncbi:hypothetical protein ACI6Q2_19945 [Chitinophagaceae bacterium LWZ2-11]
MIIQFQESSVFELQQQIADYQKQFNDAVKSNAIFSSLKEICIKIKTLKGVLYAMRGSTVWKDLDELAGEDRPE